MAGFLGRGFNSRRLHHPNHIYFNGLEGLLISS
jgi:hypothetical protein